MTIADAGALLVVIPRVSRADYWGKLPLPIEILKRIIKLKSEL
jgi:hypothetical protein